MILKKPKKFVYLKTLKPLEQKFPLNIKYLDYINAEYSTEDKINERKNPFSLSGSKAKQIVLEPYSRYQEVILEKEVKYSDESLTRMKLGNLLEDIVTYHLVKPTYENNKVWDDKLIVIDKRRRYVEDMPWISYEVDLIIYKLQKPRNEYSFFETEKLVGYSPEFIINNTSGAYDTFLAKQKKYAIYDIKVSQLDVLENYDNYIYQLQLYAYFEKVNKCGLFNLYRNAKLEEIVKDYDANIINTIFNKYDEFINNLENDNIFEKEKLLSTCTEIPTFSNDISQNEMLEKIYHALELYQEYNYKEKEAKLNMDTIKDFIKIKLPQIVKTDKFNITIPLTDTDKLSFYTTKETYKDEINTKELLLFLNNNNINKVISENGAILDFNLKDFISQKLTGGVPMFRLVTKEKPKLDTKLEKFNLETDYNI